MRGRDARSSRGDIMDEKKISNLVFLLLPFWLFAFPVFFSIMILFWGMRFIVMFFMWNPSLDRVPVTDAVVDWCDKKIFHVESRIDFLTIIIVGGCNIGLLIWSILDK